MKDTTANWHDLVKELSLEPCGVGQVPSGRLETAVH